VSSTKKRFLCRAICPELAGETVPLRDIVSARNRRRRELRQHIEDRRRTADSLLEARRWAKNEKDDLADDPQIAADPNSSSGKTGKPVRKLKLYRDD